MFSTDHPSLSPGGLADGAVSATESSDSDDDDIVLSESSLVTTEKDALPDFTASLVCSQQSGLEISDIVPSIIHVLSSRYWHSLLADLELFAA